MTGVRIHITYECFTPSRHLTAEIDMYISLAPLRFVIFTAAFKYLRAEMPLGLDLGLILRRMGTCTNMYMYIHTDLILWFDIITCPRSGTPCVGGRFERITCTYSPCPASIHLGAEDRQVRDRSRLPISAGLEFYHFNSSCIN